MKILITGASGFIGKKVLDRLKNKYRASNIWILSGSRNGIEAEENIIPSIDYRFNDSYFDGFDFDVVIHIGAFIPKSGGDANNITASTSNIRSTENLINALGRCQSLKKIIFISTIDVYQEKDEVLTELTPTIPQTMYAWSKLYCEQMITTFCTMKGIHYEILRLGHVYGEGEEKYRKVMPVMVKSAIKNEDIQIYGDGEALRTFIYIDDVADAIVNAIERTDSDVINIVGSTAITINKLANLIVNLAESESDIIHIPTENPNRNLVFDNKKLRSILLSSLIPLDEGLRNEIEYMKRKVE